MTSYSRQIAMLALLGTACLAGDMHARWDELLRGYVNAAGRVDYEKLNRDGLGALDAYLQTLAAPWPAMSRDARKAALINSYNALTVRWVAGHYPVKSIWRTRHPFTEARHRLDGKIVSLDGIETELRNGGDPRVHAVLVCAARSCPPLRREAYAAERLEQQLDANTRAWLGNTERNQFDAGRKLAEVSTIFEWYRGDFDAKPGKLEGFLATYGPASAAFLRQGAARIEFLDYDWGLNDTGRTGEGYGKVAFYLDYFRNKWF